MQIKLSTDDETTIRIALSGYAKRMGRFVDSCDDQRIRSFASQEQFRAEELLGRFQKHQAVWGDVR